MQLDPRRILTFHEVARQQSFSRAAEELSLTQSAVSQQVSALERQIGLTLFHRGRGGLRLTSAGETLLGHASALAERVQLAGTHLSDLASEGHRQLRLGAFPSALATIVPTAVKRLLAGHARLEVDLQEGRLDDLAAAVRTGELHAAVCFQDATAPRREHEGTRRYDLMEEPMVMVLPPRHRLARRRTLGLVQLRDDPWTAPSREGMIARACRGAGFDPRITILSSDPLSIGAVVRSGLAVTLTPRLLAPQLEGVRILTVDGAPPRRALYVLLPDRGARPLDLEVVEELRLAAAGHERRPDV